MGLLNKLFTNGASSFVDSVGNVLDNVITTKEEKQKIDLELKKAQMDYEAEMKKYSIEERRMILGDKSSARNMAVEVQKSENASKLAKNVSPILAIITTSLAFGLFYLIVFHGDNESIKERKEVIIYILGALSAIVTQIFSFYFGSSQGSSDKNELLKKF